MKKLLVCTIAFFLLLAELPLIAQNNSNEMSGSSVKKWFKKKDWLNGADLQQHSSINKKEFARQYQLNKTYWDKAFAFIKEHNLDSIPKGRYTVDGDNVYATVTEDASKDLEKTGWESHRKYIDLQYIISGEEKMGLYPVAKSTVTKEYDDKKDLANYTAKGKFYVAGPGTFFLFFPTDAHRPNITPGGNKVVKKMVIKIRAAE
ncbi:MAG: YhcH/YjgK/YiaL family protein [Ferruginibacter sp.]